MGIAIGVVGGLVHLGSPSAAEVARRHGFVPVGLVDLAWDDGVVSGNALGLVALASSKLAYAVKRLTRPPLDLSRPVDFDPFAIVARMSDVPATRLRSLNYGWMDPVEPTALRRDSMRYLGWLARRQVEDA